MNRVLFILWLVATSAAHAADPSETGRVLMDQLNCTACHAASETQAKWLSPKAAPRLTDIGGRISAPWLMRYLTAPQETMPGTTMPDILRGLPAADRAGAAESLTHYLFSQKVTTFKRVMPDRAASARGESLFHRVGCVACHAPQKGMALPSVPLPRMAEKWALDGLRRFLLDPLAWRPSGRMPAMRLSGIDSNRSHTDETTLDATSKEQTMTTRSLPFGLICFFSLWFASHVVAQVKPDEKLDAVNRPGAPSKPLKVFILAGQSNMQGHASISTFDSLTDDPKTAPILKLMRDADGKPRVCERVWISSIGCLGDAYSDLQERKGKLTAGFGAPTDKIGPEFTFGLYMEKSLNEPILIIETSWGGRSLHTDFRPPSAGPYVWSEYELAKCKQRGDDLEKIKAEKIKDTGAFYRHMIEHVQKVLKDIKRVVPDYDDKQGYELAGFVWFQGFNDLVSDWTYDKQMKPGGYDLYAELLARFIRDVRKDLSAPKMPFVIGVMGIGGDKEGNKAPQMYFRQAQAAPAALPEFKGNVRVVQTASFWDADLDALHERMEKLNEKLDQAAKKGPKLTRLEQDAARKKVVADQFTPEELKRLHGGASNGGYHYLGAAKIMAPIGKAFADALIGPVQAVERDSRVNPIKVFVLAGQSNMEGQGFIKADSKRNEGKGSLEYLTKDPATAEKYKHLIGPKGDWAVRDDVWIHYLDRKGKLTVGYGAKEDRIGPELGFGNVIGDAYEEPVLLIKLAWGGKSLGKDFRPPSSGGEVGAFYTEIVQRTKAVLGDLKSEFPELGDRAYELAGFGWHQGWNDRVNQAFNDEYEKNMANFIRDIRKDLGVKDLPFVIAETGMSGKEEKHPRALSLMKAQAAVAGYEEFKGNVAFVGTKDFWRDKERSPTGQAYHWNTNAETYYLIGDAMGTAMKKLCEKKLAK